MNKNKITKEIFRTTDENKAKDYLSKSKTCFLKEEKKITYENTNNYKELVPLLKEYFKKRIELPVIVLEKIPVKAELNSLLSFFKKILLSDSKINLLSLEEKSDLLNLKIIKPKEVITYIVYEEKDNFFNYEKITPKIENYSLFLNRTEILLGAEGFKKMILPWSVTYEDNFSFLNFKKNNLKVTSEKDNYYLGALRGPSSRLLKPHCTGIMLKKIKEEISEKIKNDQLYSQKYFSISRVFRKENKDTTHSCSFTQLEVTIITNEKEYQKVLNIFYETCKEVFSILGITSNIEIYSTYYPYTTPSIEFYDETKKLELGGGGVFNFEFIKKRGIKKVIGFALGLERCYMNKYKIKDIKEIK